MIRYDIDSSIISNYTKRRYIKNDRCNLIWTRPSVLYINGTKYKNTIGVDIKPDNAHTSIEVGFEDGTTIKLKLHITELVKITKGDTGYDVNL